MDDNSRGTDGNAVPLAAVVAGALVAVVSPVAVAVVARRTRRELDASAARQRAALDAEHERLRTTLAAEGSRGRREVERGLLDHGTVLIADFRDAAGQITLDARGRPIVTDRWRRTVHALTVFRGRLLMWFPDGSEVVDAFDAITVFSAWSTAWAAEVRAGERRVRLTHPSRDGGSDVSRANGERTLEDIDMKHLRYVVAARKHLSG